MKPTLCLERCYIRCLGLLLFFAVLGVAEAADRLELRGELFSGPEQRIESVRVLVVLSGAVKPYSARTWADRQGRFKFRKVPTGTYHLSILVRGNDVHWRTVEVTPAFADEKGVVREAITLKLEKPSSRSHGPESTVSVARLSVSNSARKEFRRAENQLRKQNVEAAVRHLEKAVTLAPSYVAALNELGTIYYQRQSYEKAARYFQEALAQDSKAHAPRVNLAAALFSLGRFSDAVQLNRQALLARPDDALANSQLGFCYFSLGQLERARMFLLRAKSLDPSHFSLPQLTLAEIYLRKGEKQAAILEMEDFLARHPDSDLKPKIEERLKQLQVED